MKSSQLCFALAVSRRTFGGSRRERIIILAVGRARSNITDTLAVASKTWNLEENAVAIKISQRAERCSKI